MTPYFLPPDYIPNPSAITHDVDKNNYWNKRRVFASLYYQFAAYAWAQRLINEKRLKTVADVGCGSAIKLAHLHAACPGVDFWGIDQENAIAQCRERHGFGHWLPVHFENHPTIPETRFDLVINSDVIEHLENPDLLIAYIKALVKPDGLILITTPEREALRGPQCRTSPNPYHGREWSKSEFANYLEHQGLELLDHRVLPAIRPSLSYFYLRKSIPRWARGKSMKYNQAALLRLKPQ